MRLAADGGSENWRLRRHGTGDWGGHRDRLRSLGVIPNGFYITDTLGNPRGGLEQDLAYAGRVDLDLTLELEKLISAKGLIFDLGVTWSGGTNLSEAVGNIFQIAQIYSDPGFMLPRLYFEQEVVQDVWYLKLGRDSAANEFATLPIFDYSVNAAISGNPLAISIDNPGFFGDPIPQWALRALFHVSELIDIRLGGYLSDPEVGDPSNHGLDFSFEPSKGVLTMAEITVSPGWRKGDRKLPGIFKVGGYYDTGDFPLLTDPGLEQSGQYGWYAMFQQQVTRERNTEMELEIHPLWGRSVVRQARSRGLPTVSQGLSVWLAAASSPDQSIATMPLQLSAGLLYRGPFRFRPRDKAGLWISYGRFSENLPEQGSETVVELNYAYQAAPWLYLTPDLQYVVRPDGDEDTPNALVLGFQLGITF